MRLLKDSMAGNGCLWGNDHCPSATSEKLSFIPCLYFYCKLTISYSDASIVIDACSLCLGDNNLSTDA